MKITVFGASGGVGQQFVKQALEANHQVRAVYRETPNVTPASNLEVKVLKNFLDPKQIADLISDADIVVSCLGLRRKVQQNPWSGFISPRNFMEKFSAALVQAIEKFGNSKRLVVVSAAGVGSSAPVLNPVLGFMFKHSNVGIAYQDLAKMEERLEKSKTNWTVVRPVTLTWGRLTGKGKVCQKFGLMDSISRADVADFMLKSIEHPEQVASRNPLIKS